MPCLDVSTEGRGVFDDPGAIRWISLDSWSIYLDGGSINCLKIVRWYLDSWAGSVKMMCCLPLMVVH